MLKMPFFLMFRPNRFPFRIDEKPIPTKRIEKTEDDSFTSLEEIKGQIEKLERRLLDKKVPIECLTEQSEKITDDLKEEPVKTGEENGSILNDLLFVVDELEACLGLGKELNEDTNYKELLEKFFKKTRLIRQSLEGVFKELDISRIKSVGKVFDSRFHVPVGIEKASGETDYTIIEEESAGYIHKGNVIRQTKVIVAKSD
jgi:molecular chaperone GrpE (heat shock protein)